MPNFMPDSQTLISSEEEHGGSVCAISLSEARSIEGDVLYTSKMVGRRPKDNFILHLFYFLLFHKHCKQFFGCFREGRMHQYQDRLLSCLSKAFPHGIKDAPATCRSPVAYARQSCSSSSSTTSSSRGHLRNVFETFFKTQPPGLLQGSI